MRTYAPVVLLMAVLSTVTACDTASNCTAGCGTMVVSLNSEPDAILPVLAVSSSGRTLSGLMFLPLAEIGFDLGVVGDQGFEPRLARSWRFVDSLTIEFDLDPRATWHDGIPVTARDVEFTFELYRDTLVNSGFQKDLAEIETVTANDDSTVTFRFKTAYVEQFFDATYHMRIHPAHLLDTIPRQELQSHELALNPVGNGPYRFVRWEPGASIEFEADDSHFLGTPNIGRVIVQTISDANTLMTRLLAGETDFTDFIAGPDNIKRVENADHLSIQAIGSAAYLFLGFNFNSRNSASQPHPIFADSRVRRAITLAIDRETIVAATMGPMGSVPYGPVSRANMWWDAPIDAIPYDTAQASSLLEEAGWLDSDQDGIREKNGRPLEFEILSTTSGLRHQMAIIMESQLREIGVAVEIQELEMGAWQDRALEGQFDAILGGWQQSPKPLGAIQGAWGTGGPQNWQNYSNDEFDALLDGISDERDPERTRALWLEALNTITQDAPAVWLIAPAQPVAVHTRFENVTIRPDSWAATLWQWQVNPEATLPRDMVRPN